VRQGGAVTGKPKFTHCDYSDDTEVCTSSPMSGAVSSAIKKFKCQILAHHS